MKARISKKARDKRVKQMLVLRDGYLVRLKEGEKLKIKLMNGNAKTGIHCLTISLMPIVDCKNYSMCMGDCYDINNVCRFPEVMKNRALNSALHMFDIEEYWRQIGELIKENMCTQLRLNVGGDLSYEDFPLLAKVAEMNPRCDILFFTKSYEDINRYLRENKFPSNVKCVISRWVGLDCNNEHNLPESHVLYDDGTTTAPEFGSYYCGGNCSRCHFDGEGCWKLNNGESVVFKAH